MKYGNLDKRMKKYENISRIYLTEKMPVIIRLDGKAFHSFTKGFNRPFDDILMRTMQETTKYLCANIMNCKIGYVQSDEISLLLNNYETIDSSSWFDNNLQKMVSVSASMATMIFNYTFEKIVTEEFNSNDWMSLPYWDSKFKTSKDDIGYFKMGMFDSRAFLLPKEEVCNYFIWRQQDATKNSINMVAQSEFSHKELQGLNCDELQEKLWQEKNINWNNFSVPCKRGVCITRQKYLKGTVERHKWDVDLETPIFTQNREYIEKYI